MTTSIVYWCVDSGTVNTNNNPEPLPLFNSIVEGRNKEIDSPDSYYRCKSAQEIFKNTFILPMLEDSHLLFPNGKLIQNKDSSKFLIRNPVFGNRPAVDYTPQWMFFSEDDIEVELIPPYFHKTKASEYATILSGKFNISKWFRPINATFSLWDNSKELILSKSDPLGYIKFNTNNKIILKEFKQTEIIKKVIWECVSLKEKFPNLPLTESYNRFLINRKHKEVLEEIKRNLI